MKVIKLLLHAQNFPCTHRINVRQAHLYEQSEGGGRGGGSPPRKKLNFERFSVSIIDGVLWDGTRFHALMTIFC